MFSGLVTAIDEVDVDAFASMSAADLATAAREVARAKARLDYVLTRLYSAVDASKSFLSDGSKDAANWLSSRTGDKIGAVRGRGELGAKLVQVPVIERAFAAGDLSLTKVEIMSQIVEANTEEQAALVDSARRVPVRDLPGLVREFNKTHGAIEPAVARDVQFSDRGDHAVVTATLDHEGAAVVEQAISRAMTDIDMPAGTPWGERAANALLAISRYFLENVDGPAAVGARPLVTIVASLDELETRAGYQIDLPADVAERSALVRRLCCDARVSRVIVDSESQPIDIGRTTRLIPPRMALEIARQDLHCRWGECRTKLWACENHHVKHWADGGSTSLDNLVSLCWFHHHLLHADHRWHLALTPDRSLKISYDATPALESHPRGLARCSGSMSVTRAFHAS